MRPELQRKIDQAIRLLQSIPLRPDEAVELSYSGGKDSDVILQLAKESGIKYRAIYKNTTIDPPGTVAHARAMGAEVVMPKQSFFDLIADKGIPSRWSRFCCKEIKEYKILDKAIQGIRRSESRKRSERYKEPEICRKYGGGNNTRVYLPILTWTNEDIAEFIEDRGIVCHPLYYTNGVFHVERRVGCMGCPLATRKKRLEEFKKHPNLVKAWVRAADKNIKTHPKRSSHQKYGDGYNHFTRCLFYDRDSDFHRATTGLFGTADVKKLLEDYFKIKFNEITMPK